MRERGGVVEQYDKLGDRIVARVELVFIQSPKGLGWAGGYRVSSYPSQHPNEWLAVDNDHTGNVYFVGVDKPSDLDWFRAMFLGPHPSTEPLRMVNVRGEVRHQPDRDLGTAPQDREWIAVTARGPHERSSTVKRGAVTLAWVAAGLALAIVLARAIAPFAPDLRWKWRNATAAEPGLAVIEVAVPGTIVVAGKYEREVVMACAPAAGHCAMRYAPEYGARQWALVDAWGGVAELSHFTFNHTDVQRVRFACRCEGDALGCALDVEGRSPAHERRSWPAHAACGGGHSAQTSAPP